MPSSTVFTPVLRVLFAPLLLATFHPVAFAEPNNNVLRIDGETIITDVNTDARHLYSGWRYRSAETQALQADDFENPAFPAVEYGEELWNTDAGSNDKSCADCHGDATQSMAGVRAEMPKWNAALGKPHTMQTQVNACRSNQGADPWKWESPEMLAMTVYLGLQSRGMPLNVDLSTGEMQAWNDKGKDLYYTRVGQLNLSCANCHDAKDGKMIRADHLSQGHVNGFPTYRFKWNGLGSLHRRFKGCMTNIRATPYERGSDAFIALEVYTATRGKGLHVETPAVRN